jgi:hypothetical protein
MDNNNTSLLESLDVRSRVVTSGLTKMMEDKQKKKQKKKGG